jgi:signal transduction histidine kinase
MGARPTRIDYVLSLVLATLGLAEIWFTPSGLSEAQRTGESAGLVLVAAVLLFRRRAPTATAIVSLALLVAMGIAWSDSWLWAIAAVMYACYSGARFSGPRGALAVLAAAVAAGLVITSLEDNDGIWMFLGNFLFLLGLMELFPWAAGLALRQRHELSQRDAERAVEDERVRIARELHDIVGHALGVIVVQADGERALLPPEAADSTREALAAIAQQARDALDDVRRLLRVMRADSTLGPQPGLDDVPRLLEGMASAGLPAALVVVGKPRQLPPGVDLSAYRVVQEALTNTMRHSRDAHAWVTLRYTREEIEIEISDDGRSIQTKGSRGFGLLGMRERVALFGGSLEAGPRPAGGFRVSVHLPTRGGVGDDAARAGV